jgi:hypothetical protein
MPADDNPRERRTARRSLRSALTGLAVAALIGFGVFGFVAWWSITVERAEPEQADGRFAAIREHFSGVEPLLRVESDGRVVKRQIEATGVRPARSLRVLAYRADLRRVVQADAPFWFLKAKGPAIRFSLRDTGLDLERLGLTPTELQRYGATLVLDEEKPNGDRLLVWME